MDINDTLKQRPKEIKCHGSVMKEDVNSAGLEFKFRNVFNN